jgi:acyl-CoA synthetase (AMP-forming)/AMP-acid ligase II
VTLIGLLRAGLVAVVLDPSAGRDFVDAACARVQPRAVVCSGRARWLVPWVQGLRAIPLKFVGAGPWPFPARRLPDAFDPTPLAASPMESVDDDAPALLTFTSGSTGRPKAAVRSHRFLRAQHRELAEAIELRPGQIDLSTLPVFVLANLASGVGSVLPHADLRRPGAIDPRPVLAQIDAHGVDRSAGSPAFFARIAEACAQGGRDLEHLQRLYLGGAPVFPTLLRRMQELLPRGRVANVYGSTEAEPIAHVFADEVGTDDHAAMRQGAGLLVGRPTPHTQVAILAIRDPRAEAPVGSTPSAVTALDVAAFDVLRATDGAVGEIVVAGDHVLRGYLDGIGDDETKIRVHDTVWHRTGDAGRIDHDGRLWLLGRAAEQIFDARGVVHPFAVECAVSEHADVVRSALVRIEDRRVLAVELRAGVVGQRAEAIARELRDAVSFVELDEVTPLAKIPIDRRHNAKVDYPALRRMLDAERPVH